MGRDLCLMPVNELVIIKLIKKTKKNQTTLTNQCLCWTDWFGTFLKLEPRGEGEGIMSTLQQWV